MMSSPVISKCLAALIAARTLAMPEMPSSRSCSTCACVHAQGGQALPAGGLVEQPEEAHAVLVVDGRHGVGVAHVVHPGHVLVADALDAVGAEAVLQQGRALLRLGRHHLERREAAAQIVAGGDGAGRAGRGDVGGQGRAGAGDAAGKPLRRRRRC